MLSTIEICTAPPGTRAEALEASGIKGVTRLASRRLRWLGRFSESRSGASKRSRRIANPPQVNNLPHRNSPQRATTAQHPLGRESDAGGYANGAAVGDVFRAPILDELEILDEARGQRAILAVIGLAARPTAGRVENLRRNALEFDRRSEEHTSA